MMSFFKSQFMRLVSLGITPGLEESKKLALQIAVFDAFTTLITILIYAGYTLYRDQYYLALMHGVGLLLMVTALKLIQKQYYDLGRYLSFYTALTEIFLSADAAGTNSGYEFYYFTSITIPYITFATNEKHKAFIISCTGFFVMMTQQYLGSGLLMPTLEVTQVDRMFSLIFVVIFMIAILYFTRYQLTVLTDEVKQQQSELFHRSNLVSLGEMAGGIAHEIYNPLQTITLNSKVLRHQLEDTQCSNELRFKQLDIIESNIQRVFKMVQGMTDLSRDVSSDPPISFPFVQAVETARTIASQRLELRGINLTLEGDLEVKVFCNEVQISQVIINLLNNAIDAIGSHEEKWIRLHVQKMEDHAKVTITDSGLGIPAEIVQKIMRPFFTTKDPGKGTGLGLSVSLSLISRNDGRFYYDSQSPNTTFVIELPLG